MADNEYAIDLRGVTKVYKRKVRALDGVEMHVRRGEVFGLLGPNGAGKSTLVKIIMSVVRPTQAVGKVLNCAVGSKASLAKVGYLPEHHRFPRYLTGRQTLEFFAALSNVERAARKKRAAELLETVGMTAWADARVGTYSKGMMQRVGVAQALVNDPDLVILDEPTDGVDPVGRREIRDVLLRLKSEGRTVFVNSHLLSELEVISDRVAILVGGRVVQQGTLDELTVNRQCFEMEIVASADAAGGLKAALEAGLQARWTAEKPVPRAAAGSGNAPAPAPISVGLLADGTWIEVQAGVLRIGSIDAAAVQPVIDALRRQGLVLRRLQQVRPSLEDLFIEAVGGVAGGHQAGAAMGGEKTMMTQTLALFWDAYRDLHARKMFWTVVLLNVLAMLLFALFGANDHALTFLWYEPFGRLMGPLEYRILYSNAVVGVWFTWIATILALISTAGIFPDLMSSGSIDLYLSKPIGRLRLFFTKYLSGLLFVGLQVTVFAVMSFLVLGIRGGLWEPGLFLAIPLVLLFFSYLFGICVLLGVWTRSTIAALLLTLLAWGGIYAVDFVDKQSGRAVVVMNMTHESAEREIAALDAQIARVGSATQDESSANKLLALQRQRDSDVAMRDRMIVPETLVTVQKVLYGVKSFVPKTRETLNLLDRVLFQDKDLQQASRLSDEAEPEAPAQVRQRPGGPFRGASGALIQVQLDRQRPVWWIIGTSLLFEGVLLALAAWHFCTRDF